MILQSHGLTDVGLKRKHNEDAFLVDEDLNLFMVCDGMGGHAAGEVASAKCTEVVRGFIGAHREVVDRYRGNDNLETRQALIALVEQAIQAACAEIYAMAEADSAKKGMGTTIVMMLVSDSHAILAHVGDSRIYLLRNNQLHQLTEDHSLIAEQLRKGLLSRAEAEKSPYANVITRAVGFQEFVQVDSLHFELMPGDKYLLCSDGLSGYFTSDEFRVLAERFDDTQITKQLINFANARGGKDNVTAVVLSVSGAPVAEPGLDVERKLMALKRIPLFHHLTYKELIKILNIVSLESFGDSDLIIQEDTLGDEMYVLLTGAVNVIKGEIVLAKLERGSFFGEMGLIDRAPRSASIKAVDPARLMVIRRQDLLPLLRQEPVLAVKLLWSFCQVLNQRLRETNKQLHGAKEQLQTMEEEQSFLFGND